MAKPVSGQFTGTFAGSVVDAGDPFQVGRLRVRVPIIHGIASNEKEIIADNDLPWALPAGLPAGGTQESGGISWIPVPGDQVWVRFLDGELEKPVWEWGNQNLPQAKNFGLPLHAYSGKEPAKRAALTRYSHWMEIKPGEIDIWTKNNYHFTITDAPSTGNFKWQTELGYIMTLDDATQSYSLTVPHVIVDCTDVKITAKTTIDIIVGEKIDITVPEFFIASDEFLIGESLDGLSTLAVSSDSVKIGVSASDPVVRLSDLKAAFATLKAIYDVHVHGDTPVPSTPLTMQVTGSAKIIAEPGSLTSVSI